MLSFKRYSPIFYTLVALMFLAPAVPTSLAAQASIAPAAAPQNDRALVLEHFVDQGTVLLRWHPRSASTWALGRERGYVVERREIGPNGLSTDWQTLDPGPVREADLAGWEALIRRDSLAGVTGSMLYENGEKIDYLGTDGSRASLLAQAENLNNAYLYLLMGRDLSFAAAEAAGLAFRDERLRPGGSYQYRVRMVGEDPAVSSPTISLRAGSRTYLPEVNRFNVEFTDQKANLHWTPPPFKYPSFDVFRATSERGPWQRVNPQRLQTGTTGRMELTYEDSLADNTTTYYYRLQPYTPWGIHPAPSHTVSGRGMAKTQLPTPFTTTTETPTGLARVHWELDPDGDSSLITAFYVYRSLIRDGGRQLVAGPLAVTSRSLTDSILANQQFYTVAAVDAGGRARYSVPAHFLASDTVPPPPPENIVGQCDLEGRVTLAWDHGAVDDVIGYRIFFSTGPDRVGTRITDTLEAMNTGRDSLDLRSLPDTVYYRIVALDERENVSDFSAPYALALPDVNPPAPPRLRSFTADTSGILFTWAPSSSHDVVGYTFERRAVGTSYWRAFTRLPLTDRPGTYLDETGRDDLSYEYRLVATDEVGLRSVSNVLIARRLPPKVYPAVTALRAEPLRGESRIELRWNYPNNPNITAFKVLRTKADGSLTTYRLLAVEGIDRRVARGRQRPAQWRFSDEELRRDETYVYAIQPVFRSGALGRLPPPVRVDY